MSLDPQQRLALALTLLAAAVLIVAARVLLLPFVVALLIALLVQPLQHRLVAWRLPPHAAAFVITFSTSGLMLALVVAVVPLFAADARALFETLRSDAERLLERLETLWGERVGDVAPLADLAEEELRGLRPSLDDLGPAFLGVVDVGGAVILGFVLVFLTPVVLFFLLAEGKAIAARVVRLLPTRFQPDAEDLVTTLGANLGAYLRGQGLVCLWQAFYHAAGLALIGLPYGIVIGVLTGIAVAVPIFGNFVMFVVALLVALAQFEDWWRILAVVALYGFANVLDTFFWIPRYIGGAIAVHPLLMIVAVLLGGQWFGLLGVLLALPGITVVVTAARWAWQRYERTALYREDERKGLEDGPR